MDKHTQPLYTMEVLLLNDSLFPLWKPMQVFKTAICIYYCVFLRSSMLKKERKSRLSFLYFAQFMSFLHRDVLEAYSQPAPRTQTHTHTGIRPHAHTYAHLGYTSSCDITQWHRGWSGMRGLHVGATCWEAGGELKENPRCCSFVGSSA